MAFWKFWQTEPQQKSSTFTLETGTTKLAPLPSMGVNSLVAARRRNPLVFGCVDVKALALMDPRLIVEKQIKGKWTEIEDHPFRQLFSWPSKKMDEAGLMRAAATSLDVCGVFYAEIVRSEAGKPIELYPLDPTKIKVRYGTRSNGSRFVRSYVWRDGSYVDEIPPEDMLVHENWEMGGRLSRLAVALGDVELDNFQTDFVRAYFDNAGMPSGLLKIKGRTINPEESEYIRSTWRARYTRLLGKQHDIAVLDENADYQKVGSNLKELDSETIRGVSESRICMAFGVPPLIVYAYVGLLRATYSNLKEAWASYWDARLSPELRQWNTFFARSLLSEFEDERLIRSNKIRLRWDLSQVAALQEDVDKIHDRARKAFISGGTTVDEYRSAIGMQPHHDPKIGSMTPYIGALMGLIQQEPKASQKSSLTSLIEGRMGFYLEQYLNNQYELAASQIEADNDES